MSNMYAFLTFVVSFKHACFDILFIVIELFAGVFFFFFFYHGAFDQCVILICLVHGCKILSPCKLKINALQVCSGSKPLILFIKSDYIWFPAQQKQKQFTEKEF